jgi:hypothetical protein
MSKNRRILESFPEIGFPQNFGGTLNVDGANQPASLDLRNRIIFGQDPNPRSVAISPPGPSDDHDIARDFLINAPHTVNTGEDIGSVPGPFDLTSLADGKYSTWTVYDNTTYTVESAEAPNILSVPPNRSQGQHARFIRMLNIDKTIQRGTITLSGVSASITLPEQVNPRKSWISHQGVDAPGSDGTGAYWVRWFFSDDGATLNVARGIVGATMTCYFEVIEFSSIYNINCQDVEISFSGTEASFEIDEVDVDNTFVWRQGPGGPTSGTLDVRKLAWYHELFDSTTIKTFKSAGGQIKANLRVIEFR